MSHRASPVTLMVHAEYVLGSSTKDRPPGNTPIGTDIMRVVYPRSAPSVLVDGGLYTPLDVLHLSALVVQGNGTES